MRNDRVTKLLLALIATGLWALTMTQLELPEARAETSHVAAEGGERQEVASITSLQAGVQRLLIDEAKPISRTPTSTKPLRWRIATAQEVVGVYGVDCMTVVKVVNTSNAVVNVDVEWFNKWGSSLALGTVALGAGYADEWITDNDVDPGPFLPLNDVNLDNFVGGYAHVNADDPRILASGYLVCRTGAGFTTLASITAVDAYPVGATAQYFQAAVPATWTPPMAEPEVPE